jgi:molybdate transport system ATP-binding protein
VAFKNHILKLHSLSLVSEEAIILSDISFGVEAEGCLAVVGKSGSGKTSLAKVIAGQFPISSGSLEWYLSPTASKVFVPQQHDFRDLFNARSYYQRRFDGNYGDEFPKVSEVLKTEFQASEGKIVAIANLLKISHILDSRLLELSNGESKRLQIARALLYEPKVLILDNPFIGLDQETRLVLHQLIQDLKDQGVFVFLVTTPDELPVAVSHVMVMESGKVKALTSRDEFVRSGYSFGQVKAFPVNVGKFEEIRVSNATDFQTVVKMQDVKVDLGGKTILQGINWTVKKGERWAIVGPNGSGKSTLLSLINADNPQAYKNKIYLFDQRRGSGESIWEIKRKIGYVSPELHIYFKRDHSFTENLFIESGQRPDKLVRFRGISCLEVIASGYHDQVGSTDPITRYQERTVYHLMELLGMKGWAKKGFYYLPLGQQRLVLLARALVKNPPLLILDEPCQGLDAEQTNMFKNVVDAICQHTDKTLLYVSHYPQDIPDSVDKVLRLDAGRIVE